MESALEKEESIIVVKSPHQSKELLNEEKEGQESSGDSNPYNSNEGVEPDNEGEHNEAENDVY
jgi:hypothetical protein